LLIVLAALTVVGMAINSSDFWTAYNYITLAISAVGGFSLLRGK